MWLLSRRRLVLIATPILFLCPMYPWLQGAYGRYRDAQLERQLVGKWKWASLSMELNLDHTAALRRLGAEPVYYGTVEWHIRNGELVLKSRNEYQQHELCSHLVYQLTQPISFVSERELVMQPPRPSFYRLLKVSISHGLNGAIWYWSMYDSWTWERMPNESSPE